MADVKWIKIVTDVFDDQKVRFIETMPNGDEIIVIWFKLICLAGKCNSGGFLMMTDRIAYTEEMLASIFNRDIKLIHLAINTFETLDMVEVIDNAIYISNWEKHQNAEKLEHMREQNKIRQTRYRHKQIGSNAKTVTQALCDRNSNATDIDKESKNKSKDIYGTFKNVKLTKDEVEKLNSEYGEPKANIMIEFLSSYREEKGYKNKSDYLSLRRWVAKAVDEKQDKPKSNLKSVEIPDWYKED